MELALLAEMGESDEDGVFAAPAFAPGLAAVAPVAAAADSDEEDHALALVAGEVQFPFERRSERLMEHARKGRRELKEQRRAVELQEREQQQGERDAVILAAAPKLGKLVGLTLARSSRDPLTSAALTCRRAFSCAVRSDRSARKAQGKAAKEVDECMRKLQYNRIWERLVSAPASGSSVVVRLWAHEMDTTKQIMRLSSAAIGDLLPGEVVPAGQFAQTVMVQTGRLHVRVFAGPGVMAFDAGRDDMYVCKGLVLDTGGADAYLEALVARLPFDLEDSSGDLQRLSEASDWFWLQFALDRDLTNAVMLKPVYDWCARGPENILPHTIACLCHGLQLAKDRVALGKQVSLASSSLSRLFRKLSFYTPARQAVLSVVRGSTQVVAGPRLPEDTRLALQLAEQIYGAKDLEYLGRRHGNGRLISAFGQKLFDFLGNLQIRLGEDGAMTVCFVHNCFVAEGSPEELAGLVRGGRCCPDEATGKSKVAASVCNFVFGACWEVSCISRWKYVTKLFKRTSMLNACDGLLDKTLAFVRDGFGPDFFSLEADLERVARASPDNQAVKDKLRLLKACKALLHEDAAVTTTVLTISFKIVDELQLAIQGNSKDGVARATLLQMVDPSRSPLAVAVERLLAMFEDFPSGENWALFRARGLSGSSVRVRRVSRGVLTRLSGGLETYYVRPLGTAPEVLVLTLPSVDLPRREKKAVVKEFQDTPRLCLPLGARRLAQMCEGLPLGEAMRMIRQPISVLGDEALLASDKSERDHAQFRCDLRSEKTASNFDDAASRVFCRTARQAHIDGGGSDPLKARLFADSSAPTRKNTQVRPDCGTATTSCPPTRPCLRPTGQ